MSPFVEPDIRGTRRPGRGARTRRAGPRAPAPGARTSWTGALLVAGLLTGGTATGVGLVGTASPTTGTCDVGASEARLAQARHLVTALRLGEATDPRRATLARDLRALGVTPAVSSGWRQEAVDVSDRLQGTTDPALRRVAITLARAGVGPTPADLAQDIEPSPIPVLLNSNQSPRLMHDAIAAAEQAISAMPSTPTPVPTADPRGGLAPRPRTDPPKACSNTEGSVPKDDSTGDSTDAPATTEAPATEERSSPSPVAPGTTTPPTTTARIPQPDTASPGPGSVTPSLDPSGSRDRGAQPDTTDSVSDSVSDSASPSPDGGGARPGPPGDLRGAADAVQAVADLLRRLSGESNPNAQQLAEQIRRLVPQLDSPGAEPSTGDSTSESTGPESTGPGSTSSPWSGSPRSLAGPGTSSSVEPSGADDTPPTGSEDKPGGWESQADDLADQARDAAGNDPLARELASKLDAAGFGGGGSGTDTSEPTALDAGSVSATDSAEPDTPDSPTAVPRTPGSSTDAPTQETTETPESPETSETPETDDSASATPGPDTGTARPAGGEVASETWDRLAQCESSGDWTADTGNRYSGGLQFAPATWEAFGGQGSAADASRDEQIAVAEQVKKAQGWSAWPSCSRTLGLR